MTSFQAQQARITREETQAKGGDEDTGNDNNWVDNYGGMPLPSVTDLDTPAAGEVPWTFDELHPEYQNTAGPPRRTPTPTQTRLAPRYVTRQFVWGPNYAGDPLMILQNNPHRISLLIGAIGNVGSVVMISQEPGALVGGQGAVVPQTNGQNPPFQSFPTSGEVYALPAGTQAVTLQIIEFLDN